jgi:hypothetical protein
MRLTGFEAIEFAEKAGLTLHKEADSIDDGVEALSIAEAEAIADSDPDLIWIEVDNNEYYGEPRNMEPGGGNLTRPPRLAGQRPDELLPGQNSGARSRDIAAAGTPGGGSAAGGLGGSNAPDGQPDEQLEDAMAYGHADNSGDTTEQADEPQSGRAGGAVGGTPAGKRVRPR